MERIAPGKKFYLEYHKDLFSVLYHLIFSCVICFGSSMDITKRSFFMNSFFTLQISYCPLIWICHSRTVNSKINKLHERYLRIVYNDKKSSLEELLDTDKSLSIYIKNLQVLATELFKVFKNISPPIVRQFFQSRNNDHNLRQSSQFELPDVRSVFVEQKIFYFLVQKSGILFLMNLSSKHHCMLSKN